MTAAGFASELLPVAFAYEPSPHQLDRPGPGIARPQYNDTFAPAGSAGAQLPPMPENDGSHVYVRDDEHVQSGGQLTFPIYAEVMTYTAPLTDAFGTTECNCP